MRFPLALTVKIAGHILSHKLRGIEKFATVLQLEPLHTCNLTCTGCGRIREYSTSLKNVMSLEDCLGAAQECNAPMVSICGGEPLIYPQIEALVAGLREQGRIVYLCTNATSMRRKMRDYLAALNLQRRGEVDELIEVLRSEELVTARDIDEIRNPRAKLERRHRADAMVLLECSPRRTRANARHHRRARWSIPRGDSCHSHGQDSWLPVATNTTVYRETDPVRSSRCLITWARSESMVTRFRLATTTTPRRKTCSREPDSARRNSS
jgi:organic radical activating enzyme